MFADMASARPESPSECGSALPRLSRPLFRDHDFVLLRPPASTQKKADITTLELSDCIDEQTIQGLMDDFFGIVHLPMVIVDLEGKVVAGAGLQPICMNFHRVNPDSCRNCVESDTKLTLGIKPGEHRVYKCKNGMWDVATPLIIGEQHIGNIFSGQFFFDDEQIDREHFVQQARQYGFQEQEYMAALERVPRLSRDMVDRAMSFMTRLAHILSQMSYSKLKMAQSIRERRQAEEALIRSEKLALVGQLAGGVAHDFNNLLMVISSYSELLGEYCTDERQRGYVQQLVNAARRGGDLTAQLLAFSRQQIIAPRILNLNEVLNESMKMLPRLIGEHIEVESKICTSLEDCEADPGQVQQVIMNLCINARDAMPGGGRLTIETANVEFDHNYCAGQANVAAGKYVMLSVTDTGVGMNSETRAHIFEPFFTTKELGKGTGLGLATVYGIVTQNRGYVAAYSELGQGSTFKVYLPAITGQKAPECNDRTQTDLSADFKGTILLVEDDDALRQSSTVFLQARGYSVLSAQNGSEAIAKLKEFPGSISVMLTDVIMPGMSGPELAKQVVALRPTISVVYMSGYPETSNDHAESGVRGFYLQKPFTLQSLADLLAKLKCRDQESNCHSELAKPT